MQTRMFMWRWQNSFRNAIATLLQNILTLIELPTKSQIVIMGIPAANQNPQEICFHPESCGFDAGKFENVFAIAKQNFDSDPEQLFFMGAAHKNQAHRDSLYPKALGQAVQSLLQEYDSQRGQVSFCSFPIRKNDHWIIAVVQLDRKDFANQYKLTKQTHEINPLRQSRIERCFLEAIVYRILKEGEAELRRASEGNVISLGNPERAIEDAASSLLKSVEVHINQWNKVDLFSFANAIAAERYEGAASEGRLIICQTDHPDISAKIKLEASIQIYNYRGIRKLLEVSSTKMALLCDVESV